MLKYLWLLIYPEFVILFSQGKGRRRNAIERLGLLNFQSLCVSRKQSVKELSGKRIGVLFAASNWLEWYSGQIVTLAPG